jgi:GH25 family lysozyme M1 (1,4-beta-N-acetylmuramidase)
MAHQHNDADDKVATALSDNLLEQTQGRNRLSDIDFDLLAESAMDAVLDYEDEMNQEYIKAHPDCLTDVDEVIRLRRKIASSIRKLPCVYTGTQAIAFAAARELAAQIAEDNE